MPRPRMSVIATHGAMGVAVGASIIALVRTLQCTPETIEFGMPAIHLLACPELASMVVKFREIGQFNNTTAAEYQRLVEAADQFCAHTESFNRTDSFLCNRFIANIEKAGDRLLRACTSVHTGQLRDEVLPEIVRYCADRLFDLVLAL